MPRLRQVPRDQVTDDLTLRMYSMLFGDRDPVAEPGTATGTLGDWWTVFALVPAVMKHAVEGFALYRSRSVDPVLRELGQTRAGWARGSQFVYSQHCKSLRNLGVSDEKIAAVSHWGTADCFSPIERAVLAYTDSMVLQGGRVTDEDFAVLQAHLSDEEILELTYITAMYEMHATISRALRLEFDDRDEPIVEIAAPEGEASRDIGADISGDR
ncbi:MAG: carboxymuconolactone decarboxylase family protein [Acidimicrobiales bacterium]